MLRGADEEVAGVEVPDELAEGESEEGGTTKPWVAKPCSMA